MKKLGNILFSFVPFLICLGIQLAISFPMMGFGMIYILYSHAGKGDLGLTGFLNEFMALMANSNFSIAISLVYGICCVFLFGIWYFRRYAVHTKPQFKTIAHPYMLAALLLLGIGLQYVTTYVISVVAVLMPSWMEYYNTLMDSVGFDDMTLILFIYSVLVAPVCEELIFRGVTLRHAEKHMPFWIANILQAFLFGVMHMNMIQGIYAFFIGLFLGYICEYGGSITLSIFLHMFFNFIGSYLPDPSMIFGPTLIGQLSAIVVSILITVTGFVLFNYGIAKRDHTILNN